MSRLYQAASACVTGAKPSHADLEARFQAVHGLATITGASSGGSARSQPVEAGEVAIRRYPFAA